jgi:hypothetical protein
LWDRGPEFEPRYVPNKKEVVIAKQAARRPLHLVQVNIDSTINTNILLHKWMLFPHTVRTVVRKAKKYPKLKVGE